MTVFAAALAVVNLWWLVFYLYSFAEYAKADSGYEPGTAQMLTTAFVSIAKDHAVLFASIILAYLGVAGVIQWRHGTETVTDLASATQTLFQKSEVDEKIVQEFAERFRDDESYRPIDTLPDRDAVIPDRQ